MLSDAASRLRAQTRSQARARYRRWSAKRWHVAQAAVAAGTAWFIADDVLRHPQPVFAPIVALVSLGTSYGQRLRRVLEITLGVAIGVLLGDLLVRGIGSGPWQLSLIVALAMSTALLFNFSQLFINQAAVQSIFVTTVLPTGGAAFTRWTDALIGGCVALVAASIVPAAPLRRPREQAAVVVRKISALLRAAAQVMLEGKGDHGYAVLADARATDTLIRELQAAADEGMSVVASSPFRIRHKENVRKMGELVEPLDRAIRTTRVLVRQAAVSAHLGRPVPASYASLALDLADATDQVAEELASDRMAVTARPALLAVGEATAAVERAASMNAEVVLVQLRSLVVDLLVMTGVEQMDAVDALPPPPG
ncbi:aromatic acid exporter family protein [Nocardioides sp. DS6]|uniref:Aromatic acid exporter family protein n=1 Tax=Nocardioides eburneus TaxID=3231482 RepID=A0ABV3T1M5_9ACTN